MLYGVYISVWQLCVCPLFSLKWLSSSLFRPHRYNDNGIGAKKSPIYCTHSSAAVGVRSIFVCTQLWHNIRHPPHLLLQPKSLRNRSHSHSCQQLTHSFSIALASICANKCHFKLFNLIERYNMLCIMRFCQQLCSFYLCSWILTQLTRFSVIRARVRTAITAQPILCDQLIKCWFYISKPLWANNGFNAGRHMYINTSKSTLMVSIPIPI